MRSSLNALARRSGYGRRRLVGTDEQGYPPHEQLKGLRVRSEPDSLKAVRLLALLDNDGFHFALDDGEFVLSTLPE